MNQAWRAEIGEGCNTERHLVTGPQGREERKENRTQRGTRGGVGGMKEWKAREDLGSGAI